MQRLILSFLVVAASSSNVTLVSFDGQNPRVFKALNDPVMGGKSTSTWSVDTAGGFGVFDGDVADIPYLSPGSISSPGFIKAVTDGAFPGVASSDIFTDLVLTVRSSTPEYTGFRISFASGAKSPSYSCGAGGSLPFSRGCFKAKFSVPIGNSFQEVRIPLSAFSDKWSPATGEQTTTCDEDSNVCATSDKVSKIQRMALWAEGVHGKVHLEIKSVALSTGQKRPGAPFFDSIATATLSASTCSLYKIADGLVTCGQSDVNCLYASAAKLAEKGLKDGTCSAQGYTKRTGTNTLGPYPIVGKIIVTTFIKQPALLSLSLRSSSASVPCPTVTTQPDFDLQAYISARWYIQQQMATEFLPASDNFCVYAEYKMLPKKSLWGYTVQVHNYAEKADGTAHDSKKIICAKVDDPNTDAKLRVGPCFLPSFLGLSSGPLWVVAYNETEGSALVSAGQPTKRIDGGGCSTGSGVNGAGLWIFTRQRQRDEALVQRVRGIAAAKGFDLSVLKDVDQTKC